MKDLEKSMKKMTYEELAKEMAHIRKLLAKKEKQNDRIIELLEKMSMRKFIVPYPA